VSGRWFPGITPSRPAPVDLDTGVPHPARIYDYILGGKDNFAADEPQPRPSPLEAGGYVAVARKD
jgi:S-adenosyl methyltransferase